MKNFDIEDAIAILEEKEYDYLIDVKNKKLLISDKNNSFSLNVLYNIISTSSPNDGENFDIFDPTFSNGFRICFENSSIRLILKSRHVDLPIEDKKTQKAITFFLNYFIHLAIGIKFEKESISF